MSDRGIPRSYRTTEGSGVHTFRLINAEGVTALVKFHWKALAGVHSPVWGKVQIAAGVDPDFHRPELSEAIASQRFPQWELGVQVMADDGTETFEGISNTTAGRRHAAGSRTTRASRSCCATLPRHAGSGGVQFRSIQARTALVAVRTPGRRADTVS